jgi:hypothetical protein
MNDETLIALLSDGEVLKLERWNDGWVATYTVGKHTFHTKDSCSNILLADLLKWRKLYD